MATSPERAQALAELKPPTSIGRILRFLQELLRSGSPFETLVEAPPIGHVGLSAMNFARGLERGSSRMHTPTQDVVREAMALYSVRAEELREFTHWVYRYELLRSEPDRIVEPKVIVLDPGPAVHDVVIKEHTRVIVDRVEVPVRVPTIDDRRRVADLAQSPSPRSTAPAQTPPHAPDAMRDGLARTNRNVWTTNLAGAGMLAGIHMGMASSGVNPGLLQPMLAATSVGGGAAGILSGFDPNLDAPGMPRWQQAAADPAQGAPVLKEKVRGMHFWQQGRVRDLHATAIKEVAEDPIAKSIARPMPMSAAAAFVPVSFASSLPRPSLPGSALTPGALPGPGPVVPTTTVVGTPPLSTPSVPTSVPDPYAGLGTPLGVESRPSFVGDDPLASRGLPPEIGAPEPPMTPELGQVTLFAPPMVVASPEAEAAGSAVAMNWSELARSSGPLTVGSLTRLAAVLPPGASFVYPAIPQPGQGVNLSLGPELVQQVVSRGYNSPISHLTARSLAGLGQAASGSTGQAERVTASVVPYRRPMGEGGSVLGERANAPASIQQAGQGQATRGSALDFLGVPIRMAPSLGTRSELRQEQQVQSTLETATQGAPVRPQTFGMLRQTLFPTMQSVSAEPDRGAWRQAAPSFGLRSADPQAILARDARIRPPTPSESSSQVGTGSAPGSAPPVTSLPIAPLRTMPWEAPAPPMSVAASNAPSSVPAFSTVSSGVPYPSLRPTPNAAPPAPPVAPSIPSIAPIELPRPAPAPTPVLPAMRTPMVPEITDRPTPVPPIRPATRAPKPFEIVAPPELSLPAVPVIPSPASVVPMLAAHLATPSPMLPMEVPSRIGLGVPRIGPEAIPMAPSEARGVPSPVRPSSTVPAAPSIGRGAPVAPTPMTMPSVPGLESPAPSGTPAPEFALPTRPTIAAAAPERVLAPAIGSHRPSGSPTVAIQRNPSGQSPVGSSPASPSNSRSDIGSDSQAAVDLDDMAGQVWTILKRRLTFESQRHGRVR